MNTSGVHGEGSIRPEPTHPKNQNEKEKPQLTAELHAIVQKQHENLDLPTKHEEKPDVLYSEFEHARPEGMKANTVESINEIITRLKDTEKDLHALRKIAMDFSDRVNTELNKLQAKDVVQEAKRENSKFSDSYMSKEAESKKLLSNTSSEYAKISSDTFYKFGEFAQAEKPQLQNSLAQEILSIQDSHIKKAFAEGREIPQILGEISILLDNTVSSILFQLKDLPYNQYDNLAESLTAYNRKAQVDLANFSAEIRQVLIECNYKASEVVIQNRDGFRAFIAEPAAAA